MAAGVAGFGSAASAETYEVPVFPLVAIGTDGSDAGQRDTWTSWVAVSQGGCANGSVAVAIGDSGHPCPTYWPYYKDGQDAAGSVAIGVLGGDSNATVLSASDTGDAHGCYGYILDSCYTGLGISGTGFAEGRDLAVSGTGNANADLVAVAPDGDAAGLVAVSGTGAASPRWGTVNFVAVSGTGTATSEQCNGDVVHDVIAGYAVSVAGDAHGCTSVSVLGDAGLAP